jgi:branched-chain amino acid transport system substrate-binding protein
MIVAHAASPFVFDRGFKYLFATLTGIDDYTSNMIKMAADAKPRAQRVALISENSLLPKPFGEGAARQAKEAGLEVVYNEIDPSGTKDFSPMLAAMKSKNPDLLLMAGYTGDTTVVARQIAEGGIKLKMFGVLPGPTLPGFVEALGPKADGILEPIRWTSNMAWKDEIFGWTPTAHAELFKKEYGRLPDCHPPQSTAALEVYQRALEKAGAIDPRAVRDAIAQTNMMTAYRPIRFNEQGQNFAKGTAVVQLQNGRPCVVHPLDGAEAKFVYPLPH